MLNSVYLHITQRCQLHCRYCYFDADDSALCPEMKTEELLRALDVLKSIGTKKLVFTGGEPLLRSDLFLLASYAQSFTKTVLATNGLDVTEENKYDILESFDDIRISVDGTRERHDAYRGKGTYEKALEAAGILGEQCAVRITYTREDEGHVGELLGQLAKNHVRRIYSGCVRMLGRATDAMLPSAAQISLEEARFFGQENAQNSETNCACGAHCCIGKYMSIFPNGDLYHCHVLRNPAYYMGNILTIDAQSILDSPVTKRLLRTCETLNPGRFDICIGELMNQVAKDNRYEV